MSTSYLASFLIYRGLFVNSFAVDSGGTSLQVVRVEPLN